MTIETRLQELIEIARKLPKFKAGEHVFVTEGIKVYQSANTQDFFSIEFGGIEVNKGITLLRIEFSPMPTSLSRFDIFSWFDQVESLLTKEEKKKTPTRLQINGVWYVKEV